MVCRRCELDYGQPPPMTAMRRSGCAERQICERKLIYFVKKTRICKAKNLQLQQARTNRLTGNRKKPRVSTKAGVQARLIYPPQKVWCLIGPNLFP